MKVTRSTTAIRAPVKRKTAQMSISKSNELSSLHPQSPSRTLLSNIPLSTRRTLFLTEVSYQSCEASSDYRSTSLTFAPRKTNQSKTQIVNVNDAAKHGEIVSFPVIRKLVFTKTFPSSMRQTKRIASRFIARIASSLACWPPPRRVIPRDFLLKRYGCHHKSRVCLTTCTRPSWEPSWYDACATPPV